MLGDARVVMIEGPNREALEQSRSGKERPRDRAVTLAAMSCEGSHGTFLFYLLSISETCPFGSDCTGSFRVDTIIFLLIDCLRCESGRALTCILRYSAVKAIVGDTISASEPTAR